MHYLQQSISQQKERERIKTASKQQVLDWIVQSNKDLDSKELIQKSFLVCGISNALDGSENNLVHCAKEVDQLKVAYRLTEDEDASDDDLEADDPVESGSDSASDFDSDTDV